MKEVKKVFKFSMLVCGTIIGAGLASGQEIVVFFAQYGFVSVFFLVIVFLLFFYGIKEYLTFGKNFYSQNINQNKVIKVFDIISFFIFICVSSAMLAGANELLNNNIYSFNFPVWSLIVILISTLVVFFGIKTLINLSVYIVPIMVFGIIFVCIKGSTVSSLSAPAFSTDFSNLLILFLCSISYSCCNLVTANKVFFESGAELTKKQIKLVSIVSSTILCLLIGIIIVSILINDKMILFAKLPLIYLAFMIGKVEGIMFSFVLFLSIITTLFASQFSIVRFLEQKNKGRKKVSSFVSLLVIFFVSLIGFNEIIKYIYPLIGAFGFVMIFELHSLTLKPCFNPANNKVHSTRKDTKKNSACHNKI